MFVPLIAAIFVGGGLAVFLFFAANGARGIDGLIFLWRDVGGDDVVVGIPVG